LLNYYKITNEYLEFIIDESPFRYGKYTPGTHIPIVDLKKVDFDGVDYILILAWNYEKEIRKKMKGKFKGKYIVPLPEVRVI
jgi:hypothetical protein